MLKLSQSHASVEELKLKHLVRVSDARLFDLGFGGAFEKVARKAIHAFPSRNWIGDIILWDDGTWRVSMESHMGDWTEIFRMTKGEEKIEHLHFNSKLDRKLASELHRFERRSTPIFQKSKQESKRCK